MFILYHFKDNWMSAILTGEFVSSTSTRGQTTKNRSKGNISWSHKLWLHQFNLIKENIYTFFAYLEIMHSCCIIKKIHTLTFFDLMNHPWVFTSFSSRFQKKCFSCGLGGIFWAFYAHRRKNAHFSRWGMLPKSRRTANATTKIYTLFF